MDVAPEIRDASAAGRYIPLPMTDLRGQSTFAVANLPAIAVVVAVVEAELKSSVLA